MNPPIAAICLFKFVKIIEAELFLVDVQIQPGVLRLPTLSRDICVSSQQGTYICTHTYTIYFPELVPSRS